MKNNSFQLSFISSKEIEMVFKFILNPKNWWQGLYEEIIEGNFENLDDEFSFKAGGGMHYSNQKLTELIPFQKIEWLITESHLSFLENHTEWDNTRIVFSFSKEGDKTKVVFTHEGLEPEIECFNQCSNAWKLYLNNLETRLR